MRIRVFSDLHLEFEPESLTPDAEGPLLRFGELSEVPADVVVLAGDIALGADGVAWAKVMFPMPVVCVAGNHEFYGGRVDAVLEAMHEEARGSHVHMLENEACVVEAKGERVRFLGCTLWTDFALDGESTREASMYFAEHGMNDYRRIAVRWEDKRGRPDHFGRLRTSNTWAMHRLSRAWLERELAQPFDGTTVVVTHMLPSGRSISPHFRDSPLNAAFASDLDALVESSGAALWIHGHTHVNCDYRLGATRVVCNPRGYWPDELNPEFNPGFVVDVGPGAAAAR